MKRWRGTIGLVLLLSLALVRPVTATDPAILEAAKREGKLIWYTSMGVDDSQPFAKAFERKYLFVQVEVFRLSSEQLLNKILTESRAGQARFDVVVLSGFEAHIAVKQGLFGRYASPEHPAYPRVFKDPDGLWADFWDNYYVIAYNTQLVSKADAPKTWEDLLHPRFKGKIGMDNEDFEWYAGMLEAMGADKGRRYMMALAAQQPEFRKGHSLLAQLLTAGEFPLAITYAHRIEQLKKKAAPVEWATTTDPIIVSLHPVGLSARAPHPNAGKLFIDFSLSEEGQRLLLTFNRTPARPGLASGAERLKLFPVAPSVADRFRQYIAEFNETFFKQK